MTKRVLIIGGYGNFGSYIAEQLIADPSLQIIIAGRSKDKCNAFIAQHTGATNPPIGHALDITKDISNDLKSIAPDIVIHTSGPFQGQGYSVAKACITQKCHYIDLADGRDFVANIHTLDDDAKKSGISVISGASSVPTLTSAIVDHYLPEFKKIISIDYAISTAQQTPPGVATTAAILGYAGKSFQTYIDGKMTDVYGLQDLHRHTFPEIGTRWLGNCDVPDLSLFPERYKDLKTIRFYAGLEVPLVHIALWGLSWLARIGVIRKFDTWAEFLRKAGKMFDVFGTKNSGFYMHLMGIGHDGKPKNKTFNIIARSGDGPYIPCIPSILLTKLLAQSALNKPGAYPCMDVISLTQYLNGLKDMDISVIKS